MIKKIDKYLTNGYLLLFLLGLLLLPFTPFIRLKNPDRQPSVLAAKTPVFSEIALSRVVEASFSATNRVVSFKSLGEVVNLSAKEKEYKIVVTRDRGQASKTSHLAYFDLGGRDTALLKPGERTNVNLVVEGSAEVGIEQFILTVLSSL